MEKFKTKLKYLVFSAAAVVLAFLFGAIFAFVPSNENASKTAAAINYADVSQIVYDLRNDSTKLDDFYDLSAKYPVLAENQTSSNFCWSYASLKALETAFMVQANEYHNFSDVGVALSAYFGEVTNVFNSTGNFVNFANVLQNIGLVYESDFSNDEYLDIISRLDDIDMYRYVMEYTDKTIASRALPLCFEFDTTYMSLTTTMQREVIKKFIKKYGGLFAGIEGGTYLKTGDYIGCKYKDNVDESGSGSYEAIYKRERHAVCIVGWDNEEASWIAVNSWGVDKYYEKFYIPYSYLNIYRTFAGFQILSEDNIITQNSTANVGISTGLKTYNAFNNVFEIGNNIELTYSFNSSIDFSSLYFSVSKGKQEVTNLFVANFDEDTKTMTLKMPESVQKEGTYLVRVYSGTNLVGVKEILVHSGTELAYVTFGTGSNDENSEVSLSNLHSTAENSATFYANLGGGSYTLCFLRNELTANSVMVRVGDIELVSVEGGIETRENISGKYGTLNSSYSMELLNSVSVRFNFLSGLDPTGKMIEFKVMVQVSGKPSREIDFKIIISNPKATTDDGVKNEEAFAVKYMLDGGTNDSRNINRFPDFAKEEEMTSFLIYPATKEGYDFAGWYTDSNFSNELVSNSITANTCIVDSNTWRKTLFLYAKWNSNQTEYFEGDLQISSVIGYDKQPKGLGSYVYGDSITFAYDFRPLSGLSSANYIVSYAFVANGKQVAFGSKNECNINFPDLVADEYKVRVTVNVVISRQFSVSKSDEISFSVSKKKTAINFTELSHQFDGKPHEPSGVVYSGVYSEDIDGLMYVFDSGKKIEVSKDGAYTFNVLELNNKSYELEGNLAFSYNIIPRNLVVNWKNTSVSYNGTGRLPEYEFLQEDDEQAPTMPLSASILVKDGEDWKSVSVKDAGTYSVKISNLSSANFVISKNAESKFEISPAKVTIKIADIKDRLQTASSHRKIPSSYTLQGTIFGEDDLGIKLFSDALSATESGEYEITATHTNKNYALDVQKGTYTLAGTYSVFYTLPNGEIYEEVVEDGDSPKGISDKIYPLPALSAFSYNQPLKYTGGDMYIAVSIISYTWIVVIALVIVLFVVVYIVVTHKVRKNKVR